MGLGPGEGGCLPVAAVHLTCKIRPAHMCRLHEEKHDFTEPNVTWSEGQGWGFCCETTNMFLLCEETSSPEATHTWGSLSGGFSGVGVMLVILQVFLPNESAGMWNCSGSRGGHTKWETGCVHWINVVHIFRVLSFNENNICMTTHRLCTEIKLYCDLSLDFTCININHCIFISFCNGEYKKL